MSEIVAACKFKVTENLGMYLGIPLHHERVTKRSFEYVVDRVSSRLSGWKADHLTLAGRITLAQSVIMTMPNYAMQTNKPPQSTCHEIEQLCINFIWGDTNTKRRMHLINWGTLCMSKNEGGIGLRKLNLMNNACLNKIGWGVVLKQKGLWAEVLTHKYIVPRGMENPIKKTGMDSHLWKALVSICGDMMNRVRWSVGDWQKVQFWLDRWSDVDKPLIYHAGCQVLEEDITKPVVSYVLNEDWNWSILNQMLPDNILNIIRSIPVPIDNFGRDSTVWGLTANGQFSILSAYRSLETHTPSGNANRTWKKI
ncbi:Ribonuclease H [Quillaja saponaria]|uniref:Ribonuclease H n=1 Tax=Quillaja saponaria TaxID=32244 RepID=A0AAD7KSS9_QUISA|nr:Ribonuclease H [Quillaja saponaria]